MFYILWLFFFDILVCVRKEWEGSGLSFKVMIIFDYVPLACIYYQSIAVTRSISVIYRPLVELIRSSRSTTVQVKAASALEALAMNNPQSQKVCLDLDAPKALIRLLKVNFS